MAGVRNGRENVGGVIERGRGERRLMRGGGKNGDDE